MKLFKRKHGWLLWAVAAAFAAALLALCAPEAHAQCPLCKTAVEGAGESAARAMNLGILVLLIPPVAIFCSIFAVAFKHRKDEEEDF